MSQNANQPKRFSIVGHEWIGDILEEKPDGEYVLHSDYAALAAENERLKAIIVDECYGSDAYRKHENEAKRLTAENERLRKAGDVLMEVYCESDFYELERRDWKTIPSVADWLAAKEGSDAK